MTDVPRPLPRRPIVVANWKMYLGATATVRAARAIHLLTKHTASRVDVVLCPAFPLLQSVTAALKGSRLRVGAQDVHQELVGAYTGDVSADHLRGLARYVLVGHSERRRHHGETDEIVARKVLRALKAGLRPIICVGETEQEREDGDTVATVRRQVALTLAGVPVLSLTRCVFAYEPLWAISHGVGKPSVQPSPTDAAHMMGFIRKVAADRAGRRYAERLRVIYGGSVDRKTVRAFVEEPGMDGVLVGAASADPGEFSQIVREVLASTYSRNY